MLLLVFDGKAFKYEAFLDIVRLFKIYEALFLSLLSWEFNVNK